MIRKMSERSTKETLGYIEKELIERIAQAQSGFFCAYDKPPMGRPGRTHDQWLAYREALQDVLTSIKNRLAQE